MEKIKLKKGALKRLQKGHLWIYRGELYYEPENLPPGAVQVEDHRGRFVGIGDYSPYSQIAVRLLTREKDEWGKDFFKKKILSAIDHRKAIFPSETSFRLVYGEGDLLPGLIVDKYNEYLSVQILTAGMETRKEKIFDLLVEILHPEGIMERSDVPSRKLEGLELISTPVRGNVPQYTQIEEGGLKFRVNLYSGEKTGFYFDQRVNRMKVREYAKGRRVLDMFCYSGAFSLHAAAFGAQEVTSVEISEAACNLVLENFSINGLSHKFNLIRQNAFDFLRSAYKEKKQYDLVILDPPAFTKSKETLSNALRGYKEINLRALKLLSQGGILFTCSCSYHIDPELFLEMVREAAGDANRELRLLERRGQSPDHPVLLGVPETEYLKCFLFRALN